MDKIPLLFLFRMTTEAIFSPNFSLDMAGYN